MNTLKTVDSMAEALGVHNLLDIIIGKLDADKAKEVLKAIMLENGLEVQNG